MNELTDSDLFSVPSIKSSNGDFSEERSSEMMLVERRSHSKKQASKRLSELTVNKLKIQSIGLIGREKETEKLRRCLRPLVQQANDAIDDSARGGDSLDTSLRISKTKKELVFIKGFSGVGKTSLARAIKKEVDSTLNGFFAEGKFDLNNSKDEPYSGIARAYSELIREMWRTDPDTLLDIGRELCNMLGTEVEPLTFLIPELEDVVTEYSTASYSDNSMDGMQDRWKYSFRILTRLLTTRVKPLVIVIDDLQWADEASLDMMEYLITDTQNVNPLMVIGCYRSNEVGDASVLSKAIESLKCKRSEYCFDVTEISLESCGSGEVNQMIMKMMDTDDENATRDLAELCYQRTLGNPFFVIEFMNMLQREELINFNIGTMKWRYDVSIISNATMSTANVVELLQSRMQKMPEDVQLLLSISACLGPTFRVPTLETVWRNLSYVQIKGFSVEKVPALLDFILRDMLVEPNSGDRFRWVHDKVQEAALTFVEIEKDSLKFEMGKVLFINLVGKELDDALFDIADLICSGKGEKSADFASLCLKAAEKSKRMSAFFSSSRYIKNGIGMLPEDMWTTHKKLTLDLYTLGAQVELEIGHADESKNYCETVFGRNEVEMSAKIPLRVVDIKRRSTVEMKYSDAINNSLELLKDMKFKFCWNRKLIPIQAVSLLMRTIKDVKEQPEDFHLRLGRMDDEHRTIVEILQRVSYASSQVQEYMRMILCMAHIVQLTLQHGWCDLSGPNVALIGSLAIQVFGKHRDAPKFREATLSIQRSSGRAHACQTTFVTHCFDMGWLQNYDSKREVFYTGYIQGLQSGEVDMAMHCLYAHFISLPYLLGRPIDQILEACPGVITQMEEVSQTSQAKTVKCLYQMFLNLRYPQKDQDLCVLKGEVHSIEECEGDPATMGWHGFAEFQLVHFYNDPKAADKAIKNIGALGKKVPGYFSIMIDTFHNGVTLYAAARRTKKRKYKKHAIKIRKQINKWKKVGNPNVVYYCIFLDAMHAALEGKYDEAESLYKRAIQFVARSGYLHHAALFNEIYSDFLLQERNDREEAKYRLLESIRHYESWGAMGKVARLRESSLFLEECFLSGARVSLTNANTKKIE